MSLRSSQRRALLRLAGLLAAAGGAGWLEAAESERVIEVVAKRFSFTPAEIELERGEPVTLAISSLDFAHGFNVPDFGVRADLMPGRVTRIALRPMQAGRFDFLCDNFCGDGHETMHGVLIVKE